MSNPEAKTTRSGIFLFKSNVDDQGFSRQLDEWTGNMAEQFPIKITKFNEDNVDVQVSEPHRGYIINTTIKNGKMNGKSKIYNKSYVLVAELEYVDGIASGPCTLYDNDGFLFFEGYFVNGYREGRGKEYDENEKLVFDGFFSKGLKLNIQPSKEMGRGYWKEYDEKGNLIRVCQKDNLGKNVGLCYYYEKDNNVNRIYIWENGSELTYNGFFRFYNEYQKSWFEGYFVNGYRDGRGKEYDKNGKLVFDGFFSKGLKLNIQPSKEMGKEFWEEYDENGNLIRVCQKDNLGKNVGLCYYYEKDNNVNRIYIWENGSELTYNGFFRFYNEYQKSWFEGYFVNGYRDGRGKEYDENGKLVFDGFYSKGLKLNIQPSKEMGRGYWKEYDENGNLVRVCQKDNTNRYEGISYLYLYGKIARISVWKEDKEVDILKQFCDDTMIEFKIMQKVYQGGYLDSLVDNYPRNGYGEEFDTDGKTRIFKGEYSNGKRHGLGIAYVDRRPTGIRMWKEGFSIVHLWVLLTIIDAIIFFIAFQTYIISIFVLLLIICFYFYVTQWELSSSYINNIYSFPLFGLVRSVGLKYKAYDISIKTMIHFILYVAYHLLPYLPAICVLIFITNVIFCCSSLYIGFFQTSLEIKSYNYNHITVLDVSNNLFLKRINIENDCFESVKTFQIDGLNRLKTIKIGMNSFTQKKNSLGSDESKSFHILNCKSLESIQIGKCSFSDFGGKFELKNLPQLQSIQIGRSKGISSNFYRSSFVIRGNEMILNIVMIRSSKSTIHFIGCSFIREFLINNN